MSQSIVDLIFFSRWNNSGPRVGWCSGTLSGPVFQVGSGLPEHQPHLRQKIAGSTPADPTYVAEASYNADGGMSG